MEVWMEGMDGGRDRGMDRVRKGVKFSLKCWFVALFCCSQ